MNEVISLLVAFGCGCFVGFIACAAFAVGARADEPDDFDGGYRASNEPPARTRIWSEHITTKDKP